MYAFKDPDYEYLRKLNFESCSQECLMGVCGYLNYHEICFKNQEVSKILVVLLECVEISHYAKFIKG